MKLLLYCTKSRKQLFFDKIKQIFMFGLNRKKDKFNSLNGKIVAECDYEVEEICSEKIDVGVGYEPLFYTETTDNILKQSCLTQYEIENYLGCKVGGEVVGNAIHIKNLHIFDKPKEIKDYSRRLPNGDFQVLSNAPQNMMRCCELKYLIEDYILISIRPEWLCKILNGEKTIEIRKVVLKEMLKDE